MTRQPDVPSETPQGNAAVRPGLAQLPSALPRSLGAPLSPRGRGRGGRSIPAQPPRGRPAAGSAARALPARSFPRRHARRRRGAVLPATPRAAGVPGARRPRLHTRLRPPSLGGSGEEEEVGGGGASPQRPLRPPTIDSPTTRAAPRTRRPRLSGGRGAGSRTAHARQPPPFWWGRELSSGSGGGGARWARLGGGGECALAAEMANIAVQRIKREFKEVLKSEEVRAAPAALRRHPPRLRGGSAGAGEGAGARRPAGGLAAPRPHLPARRVGWSRGLGEGNGDSRGEGTHREGGRGGGGDLPQREPGGAGPARRRPGGKPPLRAGRCGAARCQPGGWGLPRPPAPPPAPRVPPTAQPSPAGPGSCGPGVMEGAGGPAASSIAFGSPLCCTSPGF